MSAVMMILTNALLIRVPERVQGVQHRRVQTVAVAPPAMTKIPAVMTANVMTVSVTIANATTALGMISNVIPRHGAQCLGPQLTTRRLRPITVESVVKASSIRKCYAVNAQKKPDCTGKKRSRHGPGAARK